MISVVTPSSALMCATTHHDLMAIRSQLQDAKTGVALGGANLCDRINAYARDAQASGATHLVIIEADMRAMDADVVSRLLKRHVHIVGANYRQRQHDGWTAVGLDGVPVSSVGKTGIELVSRVGCGVVAIDMRVFRDLPRPWFSAPYVAAQDIHQGPDFYFCEKAIAHGHRVFVDHDVSQRVRHIGSVEFGVDAAFYTESQQPVRWAT